MVSPAKPLPTSKEIDQEAFIEKYNNSLGRTSANSGQLVDFAKELSASKTSIASTSSASMAIIDITQSSSVDGPTKRIDQNAVGRSYASKYRSPASSSSGTASSRPAQNGQLSRASSTASLENGTNVPAISHFRDAETNAR